MLTALPSPTHIPRLSILPATMGSATIRTTLGIVGDFTSLGLFLAPLFTFVEIFNNGAVGDYSVSPYSMALLNSLVWLLYGLPAVHPNSSPVLVVSAIGVVIESIYIAVYVRYSAGMVRRNTVAMLAAVLIFVGCVAAFVFPLWHTHEGRSSAFGCLGIASSIAMYASPLFVLKTVVETESVDSLPLPVSVASLVNAITWTAYASIHPVDFYVAIPNIVGMVFSGAQLGVYWWFYNKDPQVELA